MRAHWLDVMATSRRRDAQPSLQWTNRAYRAALACLRGDPVEAIRLGQESVAHAEGVSEFDARLITGGIVAAAMWQRGDLGHEVSRLRAEREELARDHMERLHSPLPLTAADVLLRLVESETQLTIHRSQLNIPSSSRRHRQTGRCLLGPALAEHHAGA